MKKIFLQLSIFLLLTVNLFGCGTSNSMSDINDEEEYREENDANFSEKDEDGVSEESVDGNLFIKTYDANLSIYDSNSNLSDVNIKIIKGYDNVEGEALYEDKTAGDGSIVFEHIEKGEYTVVFEKSGFAETVENVYVSDNTQVLKYIPECSNDDDVIVVAEWKGDYDLDICFFNASTKERISYGNPVDKSGSFIYGDNQKLHYEMIYLRNFNNEEVRNIYLVDVNGAQNGNSLMESDGVKISVYCGASCIYQINADSNHSEPIWNPVYIYNSNVYENDESYHTSNEEGYDWSLLSKEGIHNNEDEWRESYANFIESVDELKGANVAKGKKGKEYLYYFFDVENDGIPELFIEERLYSEIEFLDGDIGLSSDKLRGYTFSGGEISKFFEEELDCDTCGMNEILGIYFNDVGYFTIDANTCNENQMATVYKKNNAKSSVVEMEYTDYGVYRYENYVTGDKIYKDSVDMDYFSLNRKIYLGKKVSSLLYADIMNLLRYSQNENNNANQKTENSKINKLDEDTALQLVVNYCMTNYNFNPYEEAEALTYITVVDSSKDKCEIIYRSYTAAIVHFNVNLNTGIADSYTEVPAMGIVEENGSVNLMDYK